MRLHDAAKDGAEAESIGSEVQSKSATRPFLMVMHSGTCCYLHSGIVLLLGSEAQKKCYQGRLCAFDLHGCCGTNTASYILTLLKQVIQLLVSFLTSFPHSLFFPLSPPPPPPLFPPNLLTQSPVMSVAFSKFHPSYIIGGTYSGQLVLWDIRSGKRTPVQRSPLSSSAHTHPVYCLDVVGSQNAHNLISASTDGRICSWNIDMLSQPQVYGKNCLYPHIFHCTLTISPYSSPPITPLLIHTPLSGEP